MLRSKFNNRFWLVALVFLTSKALVYFIMHLYGCETIWSNCFAHWDSGLYISIAQEGRTLFDCNYPNNPQWCGNAGWSPLYPLLMRVIQELTQTKIEVAGGIVAAFFYFLFLYYMARLMELEKVNSNSLATLYACAFFPGFIYLHAVFPLSLCLFLLAAFIYYLKRKEFLLCGFLAMLLTWSYASGQFILIAIFLYLLGILIYEKKIAWKIGLKLILPSILGLMILYFYDFWVTDHWNAMYLVQQKYKHGIYNTFDMLIDRFGILWSNIDNHTGIIQLQIFFVLILVFWFVATTIRALYNNKMYKPELCFYLGIILAFWILPFSMGLEISLYRGSILLAILLILWKDKSLDFKLMLLISFALFIIPMTAYFYKEWMI